MSPIKEPELLSFKSTRRRATVTISAPEASSAASVSATSAYFPVPTRSRERKLSGPIWSKSSSSLMCAALGEACLASAADGRVDRPRVDVLQGNDEQLALA